MPIGLPSWWYPQQNQQPPPNMSWMNRRTVLPNTPITSGRGISSGASIPQYGRSQSSYNNPGFFNPSPPPPSQPQIGGGELNTSIGTTVTQQAPQQNNDYNDLWGRYSGLFNEPGSEYQDYNPEAETYKRDDEMNRAFDMIRELAETGGYSDTDLSSMRERGISPIRSVYANAMRNLDRQRALQGGYSPNYAAASTRMNRDLSEQIAKTTTDVNADIAKMVGEGKQRAIPQYGEFAARESEAQRALNERNVRSRNEATEFNRRMRQATEEANRNRRLSALEGMRGLYGTTPALTESFGRQGREDREFGLREREFGERSNFNRDRARSGDEMDLIRMFLESMRNRG